MDMIVILIIVNFIQYTQHAKLKKLNRKKKEKIERFGQNNLSMCKQNPGSGLGLSNSKDLTELPGGSMLAEWAAEQQPSLYFTMPDTLIHHEKNIPGSKIFSVKSTILIAEDVDINFLLLEELFNSWGYKTVHAKNGKVAVECCKHMDDIVLVFMDIKMPVMDGFSAAKLIRPVRPDLPIIAQSGYSFDDEREGYGSTFNEYISKPFDLNELEAMAKKYISIP